MSKIYVERCKNKKDIPALRKKMAKKIGISEDRIKVSSQDDNWSYKSHYCLFYKDKDSKPQGEEQDDE